MSMTLAQAPIGRSLRVRQILGSEFAVRVARLGLYEGARLLRLSDSAAVGPVKVRGSKGDAILSGWLAKQVVIHLDNDHRLPLLECNPRDSGHVEGLTGQTEVEESLQALGIVESDRLSFVRRMPPMTYTFSVFDKGVKANMNEGLASHLLGDTSEGPRQFSSIGVGEVFVVRTILPGECAESVLASMDVVVGSELVLHTVSVSHDLELSPDHPIACVTKDGVRLYFAEQDAASIFVQAEPEVSPEVHRLYGVGNHG